MRYLTLQELLFPVLLQYSGPEHIAIAPLSMLHFEKVTTKKMPRSRILIQTSGIELKRFHFFCFRLMSRNYVAFVYNQQIHYSELAFRWRHFV